MFSQFEPNVKAAIAYLKLLKVKVNDTTVNESLQNHPDWPSLLCVSDCLNKWNIPNAAGKMDVSKIDELPTPFIAYTSNREAPLTIISEVSGNTVQSFNKNYDKVITETKEDFLKKWNGIYLIAEPNEHSGEPNYEANKRKELINSLIPVAAFCVIAILSFIFINRIVTLSNSLLPFSATGIYIQYFILLTGVFITALLLWYEIDKSNPLLQKVCTGIAKGDCNAILTGKQAKVFSWLSWSEVGFFYFAGGLLTLLLAENSVSLLAWLNVLALPYILFSIYYQWRVAKQWCVLCLGVQALLLLGGTNVIANNFLYPLPVFSLLLILKSALLFMLPALIWFVIKPSILKLLEAKNTKREYLRIKFNAEIFDTLLKKQKQVTISTDELGINIGNPAAVNSIIKVCNPYCGPCATAHPKIEELLKQNDSVKAKIIFNTSVDDNDLNPAIKPTRHLMAIAEQRNNKEIINQSLDDWYLHETKNYEIFAKKYPMNGELLRQDEKIKAMKKWCEAMEIKFTPTIFINGYQLPDAYNIEDLQYFLLE